MDAVQLEEAAVARVQAAVAERFAAAIASEEVNTYLDHSSFSSCA